MGTRNERVNRHPIRCYDNGGKTADRYTVIYMNEGPNPDGTFASIGMSQHPTHPQGYGMHGPAAPGVHLGKRIKFASLPEECQKVVLADLQENT